MFPSSSRAYRRSAVWSGPLPNFGPSASLPLQPRERTAAAFDISRAISRLPIISVAVGAQVRILCISLSLHPTMPRRCRFCGEAYYTRGQCASGLIRCREIHERFLRLQLTEMPLSLGAHPPRPEPQAAGWWTASQEPAEEPRPADAVPGALEVVLMNAARELQEAINLMSQGYSPSAMQVIWPRDMLRLIRDRAGIGTR